MKIIKMRKYSILKLDPIKENYPTAWFDLYERELKLPFLYHYYYRSNSFVRKYVQYLKRPEKAVELLCLNPYGAGRILDIGCDWGYLLMLIKSRYPNIQCHGVDIDAYSCEFGVRLAKKNNLDIDLKYANAKQLPFDDNSFDFVVSTGTFEHILPEWREDTIKEIVRVVKKGGRVVVLFPNPKSLSQKIKDFLSERSPLGKHTMWLPDLRGSKEKVIKLTHSRSEDDVISVTDSETVEEFSARLERWGLRIEQAGAFVFMVEFIPNWFMKPAVWIENIVENNRIMRRFCTTLYFSSLNERVG